MKARNLSQLGELTDEKRLKLLVASVSDYAIYMLDPDGYVSSWNAGAQRFKGYLAHEIIGKHFSVFYREADRAAGVPAKALETALDKGKFEAEAWRLRKDGSQFWASVVIDPIRTESGELVGFAKVTRDITERKAAQEALRESEERFRLLVQGVTDYAIYMLSPAGIITNWNVGAERIKGYSHNEVLGSHFSRFYTEEDRLSGAPSRVLSIAAAEGRHEQEGWRVRKDGTRFWAHVVVDAIRNDQEELVGFAKVTRDITEKRAAAEALQRVNAALFQSQKMEAIGQLTGGIAHDFNNLLAVMSSSLDLLSTRLREDNDVRLLESMQRAVTRGSTLTQQLLSFARQQPLKVERYNLNSIIREFESVLLHACNPSTTFEVNLDPALATVILDAARFEAALLNLVVNARDAMQENGKLTLRTENIRLEEADAGDLKPALMSSFPSSTQEGA
jgi:PAS domain S-box-containing protein